MRTTLLVIWLLIPLAAWTYHEGPGQELKKLDQVDDHLQQARTAAAEANWPVAIKNYEAALGALPAEKVRENRRVRLALDKARIEHQGLVQANASLRKLVAEMEDDATAEQVVLDEARRAFANSQYYITWLMRLEGYAREEWEPEIEVARQNYRLLAERADTRGDAAASKKACEDLEAAVKLARIDLEELQGLPLPSQ